MEGTGNFSQLPNDENSIRRIRMILAGRLVVASILLGSTLYFASDALRFGTFTPTFLLILISMVFVSSIVFAVGLNDNPGRVRSTAIALISLDLLLTTGLLYVTGGAGSIFSALYGAEILTAAMTLGAIPAYVTAFAAILSYFGLGMALSAGWVIPPPGQPLVQYTLGSTELSTALLTNMLGIAFVALLATNLASRLQRTGGKLVEAEQSAAHLAQLNNDIVRSIASGLITTDKEGLIVTVNPAAHDILGGASTKLIGQRLSNIVPNVGIGLSTSAKKRRDAQARRSDGTEFPIGYTLGRLVDVHGEETGYLLAFQDLTEIRELRDKADRAERLAVLGHLATGLAHEIRNPLSSISGSVEIVRDGSSLEEEDNKLLGIVIEEVERLNQLVTGMLSVGRPRELQPVTTDLCAMVRNVAIMARADAAAAKGVLVEAEAPDNPLMARVDPAAMRQVIWNLVKNAIEASPRDSKVIVRVAAHQQEVALEVIDSGSGIPDDLRDRLFDMFYSGRPYGVGIGLALVKLFVEQHGGQIEVLDRPTGGTVFRVKLSTLSARQAG